ncbi:Nuf2 domain-containing protein [Rhizoctonia solani AG-1 IA]|uniref:Nuf2 domain-containing protein n=1 Tax=Thanatephorus cucumeris (strain AG1-IA) TaxID=983506 RepID=L8X8S9_THACA|nr:Nuf2 domain-containing protein [Rhizoctonia solani AG-1 IA]
MIDMAYHVSVTLDARQSSSAYIQLTTTTIMSGDPYDQPGSNFSFVILSPQDISEWIASYDVSISVEELAKPTPQTVEMVYTVLIELYKNISTEDQENTKLRMLEHQENQVSIVIDSGYGELTVTQELYGDIFYFHILYHHLFVAPFLRGYLQLTPWLEQYPNGGNSQRIAHFPRPHSSRTAPQSQMPEVTDLKTTSEQSFERRERAKWERAQAEGRLKEYKDERASEQPEVDQLRDRILEVKNELPGLQKGYQKANEARTALKKEQLQKLNEMIIAKSERNDELRARLVDDPELFQKNIREATESLNNIRQLVATEEAKSRDLKTRLDWLGSVETVSGWVECRVVEGTERARWTEADKALREIELDLNKRVIDHREMSTKRDVGPYPFTCHLSRQLEHTTEKYTRAQRHGEESRIQAEATAQQLREAYDQGLKERSATSEKAEEVRRMVAEVEAQVGLPLASRNTKAK